MTRFAQRVLAEVRRIPPGRVATYGDIAAAAGRPRAWRAVGNLLSQAPDLSLPWHRVVHAQGRLPPAGDFCHLKRVLLRAEGILIGPHGIRRFSRIRWDRGAPAPSRAEPLPRRQDT